MRTVSTSAQIVTRNFLTLGTGEIVARVIGFATTIYIARNLGSEAYGIVGFMYGIILYFWRIADFGIESLGSKEIAEDRERIQKVAPSILTARLIISVVLALGLILIGIYILPQPEGAVLASYSLILLTVGGSTRWIHLGLESSNIVSLARIIGETLGAVLIFVFVQKPDDVIIVPLAQVFGAGFTTILLLLWLRRMGFVISLQLDFQIVWPVVKQAWPLVLTMLLGLVIYNSDLIFLRLFRDVSEIGYYLAAYTLINLLGNLGALYGTSLLPTFTRIGHSTTDQQELYHTAMAHVFAATLPLAVGGFLIGSQIMTFWFGKAYEPSGIVLQVLIWSIPFLLLRSVLQAVLISTGRQHNILWASIGAALLNIFLNLLIVPQYGMAGAAFTTVVTEIARTILVQIYVCEEGFPMTRLDRFWRTIFAALVMGGLLIIWPESLWLSLALGVAGYSVALTAVGGIRFRWGKLPVLTV